VFPGDAAGIYIKEVDAIAPTTPPPFRLDAALAALDKLNSLRPKALYYSHFGKASDPIVKLKTYANQMQLWAKIARQGIEENRSLEEVRQKIIENDEQIQKSLKLVEANIVWNETILGNSIEGFMQFAEKYGDVHQSKF
jgi:hypothetical protein